MADSAISNDVFKGAEQILVADDPKPAAETVNEETSGDVTGTAAAPSTPPPPPQDQPQPPVPRAPGAPPPDPQPPTPQSSTPPPQAPAPPPPPPPQVKPQIAAPKLKLRTKMNPPKIPPSDPVPPEDDAQKLPKIEGATPGAERPPSATKRPGSASKRPTSASSIKKSSPRNSPKPSPRPSSRPSSALKAANPASGEQATTEDRPGSARNSIQGSRESLRDIKESEKVENGQRNDDETNANKKSETSPAPPESAEQTSTEVEKQSDTPKAKEAVEGEAAQTDESTEANTANDNESAGAAKPKPKKRLTKDEVKEKAEKLMDKLLAMESYDNNECRDTMKSLGRLYWDYKSSRMAVSEILVKKDFAGLGGKMITTFNNLGIFKSDDVWFPAYYTMNNIWNYTDTSKELAKDMADKGLIRLMIANITHKPYLENLESKNVTYVVKSSLSILQNISKVPEVKPMFFESNAVEALKPFTTSENDFFKATSMMTLTTLIKEADNAVLEDTGVIPFFVGATGKALKSKNRRHRGFAPSELVACLNRMAVNDTNKMKIIDEGALPLFVEMMKTGDDEEKTVVMQCLWTLSFDKDVRDRILAEDECEMALNDHTTHENPELRHAAKGAMWKLRGEEAHGKSREEEKAGEQKADDGQQHIMISYNWAYQDVVIQIANRLKADGYKVWLDVDQMGGSTLEAMALAVENAALVLICYGEKYKLSANCRTEGEYTFQLKKPIVPCLMQPKYKADGWLGMLLGAKLFINFAGKYAFDKAYGMLVKEINGRGHPDKKETVVESSQESSTIPPPTQRPKSAGPRNAVMDWTANQVADWLKQNALESSIPAFDKVDGKLLASLLCIREEAPEFFYGMLERKMGLGHIEILHLINAFSSL